jgi:hypothetical protein
MNRTCLPAAGILFSLACNTVLANANQVSMDTIPVVVHVIHLGTPVGSADNPPDSLIDSLILQINNAFSLNGPEYGGADMQLHFQLAATSPECGPTTGILRVDGSNVVNYDDGGITIDTDFCPTCAFDTDVKTLSRWPNTDYLNIWIVHRIDDDPFFPGGYAFFPEYNSALNDGVVLRASVVNGTNKTIIHELGHYFFLHHTFGYTWNECEEEMDCTQDGDLICDTEICNYQFDCSTEINPCTGEEWVVADAEHGYTVLNNYMGYTNCQWMFTEDQKERVQYALNTFRPGLLSSRAVEEHNDPSMPSACNPSALHGLSPYYGIERIEIGTLNIYSNTSQADGAFYVDRTCNQMAYVAAGDSVPVRITCSYQNWSQVAIYLDLDNDGVFTPPGELLVSSQGGVIEDTFVIPSTGIPLCTPLRFRVVVDHPSAPVPTACLLTGTSQDGVGQIEDVALLIQPRNIESLNSGNWNNAAVWSCNCIPSISDFAKIKAGHILSITPQMGLMECADMQVEPGAQLLLSGQLLISGGCY